MLCHVSGVKLSIRSFVLFICALLPWFKQAQPWFNSLPWSGTKISPLLVLPFQINYETVFGNTNSKNQFLSRDEGFDSEFQGIRLFVSIGIKLMAIVFEHNSLVVKNNSSGYKFI